MKIAETIIKEIVESKDNELRKYKIKYMDSKKLLCKFYGLIRIIQEEINFADGEFAGTTEWTIDEIRSNISEYLFGNEERELDIYGY